MRLTPEKMIDRIEDVESTYREAAIKHADNESGLVADVLSRLAREFRAQLKQEPQ